MTHLKRGTLACRLAVASGGVLEDTNECELKVAERLKAEHRKVRAKGSTQPCCRRVNQLGLTEGSGKAGDWGV